MKIELKTHDFLAYDCELESLGADADAVRKGSGLEESVFEVRTDGLSAEGEKLADVRKEVSERDSTVRFDARLWLRSGARCDLSTAPIDGEAPAQLA